MEAPERAQDALRGELAGAEADGSAKSSLTPQEPARRANRSARSKGINDSRNAREKGR